MTKFHKLHILILLCVISRVLSVDEESTESMEDLLLELEKYDDAIRESQDKLKQLEWEIELESKNINFSSIKNQSIDCQSYNQTVSIMEKKLEEFRELLNNHTIPSKHSQVDSSVNEQKFEAETANLLSTYNKKLDDKDGEILNLKELIRKSNKEIKDLRQAHFEMKQSTCDQKDLKKLRSELQTKSERISDLEAQLNQLNELKKSNEMQFPNSCGELNGVQSIKVPGLENEFNVLCDSQNFGNGAIIIQRRQSGKENFYRGWKDYKFGFGNFNDDFFIGLENLYRITYSQKYELYIQLKTYSGRTYIAQYTNFRIDDESSKYTLESLGTYNGTADDGLKSSEHMKFSTFDQNNRNIYQVDCADAHQGAWWYNNYYCGSWDLNAMQKKNLYNYLPNMEWNTTLMVIRPKSKNHVKNV